MLHRSHLIAFAMLCLGGAAHATPCPNLMMVLDQSGSMDEDVNGMYPAVGPTKWKLLQDAMVALVNKYGAQLPLGIEFFSSNAFDDAQCYDDTMISIEPAHDTAADIINLIKTKKPASGTNTGEAIKRARVDPVMADKVRGEYIILVTDGDPNCNTNDFAGTAAYTVGEIDNAYMQDPSIHTFVLGFDGSGVLPDNLNAMARAGGEPIMGCTGKAGSRCYYSTNSAQALQDAIDNIINTVVGGEFGMTSCDDSCYANGCPDLTDGTHQICQNDEFDKPHCVPDPCQGVQDVCPPNNYCRAGQCVPACPKCRTGEKCVDGNCIADPCAGTNCGDGFICNPLTGACSDNNCLNKMPPCKSPTVCEPISGSCIDDPCRTITCPKDSVCVAGGNCEATMTVMTPGGGGGRRAVGCALAGSGAGLVTTFASLILALVALGRSLRRRY
jgi:von Willebrand factor type A domain